MDTLPASIGLYPEFLKSLFVYGTVAPPHRQSNTDIRIRPLYGSDDRFSKCLSSLCALFEINCHCRDRLRWYRGSSSKPSTYLALTRGGRLKRRRNRRGRPNIARTSSVPGIVRPSEPGKGRQLSRQRSSLRCAIRATRSIIHGVIFGLIGKSNLEGVQRNKLFGRGTLLYSCRGVPARILRGNCSPADLCFRGRPSSQADVAKGTSTPLSQR
jgi:hypothetical protein